MYPSLAMAARADAGTEFLYLGTQSGLEAGIVARAGFPFEAVEAGAIRGRSPVAAGRSVLRMLRGVAQARSLMHRFRPEAALATGGFVCVPVVLAARLSGIPSVVYLPDLRPGWAVRFLARIAEVVAVSFEEVVPWVPARRIEVTGYPVRPELQRWSRDRARQELGLPPDSKVVLVMGASQGARSINQALSAGLTDLLHTAHVIHAPGAANYEEMATERDELPEDLRERYRLFRYLDAEVGPALAAADLVVNRSGASNLGELPAVGVPGLLIPYPHAGAHQRLNAEFLAARGAAVILDDQQARAGALVPTILELLNESPRLASLAAGARALARPEAARRLYELVAGLATERSAAGPRRRTG